MIFYLKFYYKLKYIKWYFSLLILCTSHNPTKYFARLWYTIKYYTYKNCKYNSKGMCEKMSKALDLVIIAMILYYYQYYIRIIDLYCSRLKSKTK